MVVNGGTLRRAGRSAAGPSTRARRRSPAATSRGRSSDSSSGRTTRDARSLLCPGSQDFKRAIVVVSLDTTASGGIRELRRAAVGRDQPDRLGRIEPEPPAARHARRSPSSSGSPTGAVSSPPSRRERSTNVASNHPTPDTRGLNCLTPPTNRPDALLTSAPDELLDIVDDLDYATELEPRRPSADPTPACSSTDRPRTAATPPSLLPASRPARRTRCTSGSREPVNTTPPTTSQGRHDPEALHPDDQRRPGPGQALRRRLPADARRAPASTTTVLDTTDVQLAAGSVSKPNWAQR